MNHSRWALAGLVALLGAASSAVAEWSIGINLNAYPQLAPIPGYPVYYAPGLNANYFYYDGKFWAYVQDRWYTSTGYNGPWDLVDPYYVPLDLLQVPVSFYQRPPAYFRGWRADAPPRWAEHWGDGWLQRRADWNQPERGRMPVAAPLVAGPRQYSGASYPQAEAQAVVQPQAVHGLQN
jgi:hypothetical protein